jgi:hypothetical protein
LCWVSSLSNDSFSMTTLSPMAWSRELRVLIQ